MTAVSSFVVRIAVHPTAVVAAENTQDWLFLGRAQRVQVEGGGRRAESGERRNASLIYVTELNLFLFGSRCVHFRTFVSETRRSR